MAQHDYIIANQSGAAFRSDLNNGLAAIVSQNSGAAQPSTTYAYQWWADTTAGLLKIRNAANNAWITIGTLADANLGLLSLAGGTLTGALLADDSGTAALPAIAFDGDTNTGIFSPGADQFGIATNGVERVEFGTTEVVFNDGGADVDFRVEGDTKANLFKVDAGTDAVSIDGAFSVTGSFDIASLNGGQLAGMRNRIINGAMAADQRNGGASQSFTAAAALAYSVDRWYGYCTGANVTGQRVQGSVAGTFAYQFGGAASVTAIGFGQRIEELNSADLAGATATLSVDLANSLLTTVTWTAYYATTANTFGTLASPTRTQIATGTFTVNSTLTRYSANISISGAATTGIEIVFTVGAQTSGTWTISNVQLEPSTVATPFERRPHGAELALCQRYYETVRNYWVGQIVNTALYSSFSFFKVDKRAAPTAVSIAQTGAGNGGFGARTASGLGVAGFIGTGTAGSDVNGGGWSDSWAISAEL
jgi:hypothetical protein